MKVRQSLLLLTALFTVGAYAWVQQVLQGGDVVMDLHTIGAGGVAWGLYVVGDGFFASTALAILAVACVLRVLRLRGMENVSRMALSLGIAGLVASLGCVLADLGRPEAAIMNLPLVGRPRSPFFGTFTAVAGASLFATVVHLALTSRPAWAQRAQKGERWAWVWRLLACGWHETASAKQRRESVDFWLSLVLLPFLLGGLVILGIVFGVRAARPTWQSVFEVVTFVVSGGAAGCSLLLLAAHGSGRASVFTARMLAVFIGVSALLVVTGQILALRTPYLSVHRYARAQLDGPWSRLFWAEVILLFLAGIVSLAMAWRKKVPLILAATTALLVCAAVALERFLVLVAWQTHGLGLSWPAGKYNPTSIEWSVLVGVAAGSALVFLFLIKVCRAETGDAAEPASPEPAGRRLRWLVTVACLILGFAVAASGLALSAGFASAPFLDPILPGGPLVFLAGLFLMGLAAVAYELIPDGEVASGAKI
ncbi:MAG: NrfD/PsrC family molybdoenzyme membrane anchor subunit [Polyangia bacterium]